MKKTGEIIEVEPAIKPLGEKGGYSIGHLPVLEFGTADILKRWVQGMRAGGQPLYRSESMDRDLVGALMGCRG